MRKTMWQIAIAAITILCLAVAPAGASKERSAKATYNFDMSQGGSLWVQDNNVALMSADTVTFETTRADRMISLTVADDSAAAVSAAVWQEGADATIFCNEVAMVPITGGQPVYVKAILDVSPGAPGCETPEMPTTGTVTAKFMGAMKQKAKHHHH